MANELSLLKRLQGKTPEFFKRVQIVGAALIGLAGSIQAIPHISKRVSDLSINGIVAGGIMIAVSKFAIESSAPAKKEETKS